MDTFVEKGGTMEKQVHIGLQESDKVIGDSHAFMVIGNSKGCRMILEGICPEHIPDGLVFKPQWIDVADHNKVMVRALEFVPVEAPKAVMKPGKTDFSKMDANQLRSFAAENSIALPGDRPDKLLSNGAIITLLQKAGK